MGLPDPEIGFHETVKEIEQRHGDANIVLESFIVANTRSHVLRKQWGIEKSEMLKRHILIQHEGQGSSYVAAMLSPAPTESAR